MDWPDFRGFAISESRQESTAHIRDSLCERPFNEKNNIAHIP